MDSGPVTPRRREIPPGYVDAWGLDNDSLHVTPIIVGRKKKDKEEQREKK
jgi:hypothetical protein